MPAQERPHPAALRQAARRDIVLGALSTDPWLLARAGLLAGYRCTIHWENRAAFEEAFRDLHCTGRIYEIDRDRMTCSGGTAAMDLMRHLIAERHGRTLARRVVNQFHHERIRDARGEQVAGRFDRTGALPPPVRIAMAAMQRNIEEPLSVADLADRAGTTRRQLERLFRRCFAMSPARTYLALRVDRARELLLHSDQPILNVAVATGFANTSHFSQWFRTFHEARPSEKQGRGRPAQAVLPARAARGMRIARSTATTATGTAPETGSRLSPGTLPVVQNAAAGARGPFLRSIEQFEA